MASIAEHLRAIAKGDTVPTEALVALVERIDEAAPPLREILAKAARGRPLSDEDASLFFYGLHILAAGRDRQSFPALLQFLRRPAEEVDDLLGDAVTESLGRIAAGLFDDDADELLAAAVDRRVDDYARDALIAAATFLTFDGRIPRERMHDFLARFETQTPSRDGEMVWAAWVQSIAYLGFRDLAPNVRRLFDSDRLPPNVLEWRHFEQDLRDAERAPSDRERLSAARLGYADDVVEVLRWTERSDDGDLPDEPFVNPYRDVGRNDPCPCGSGKKYKKCCLTKG